MCIVVVLVVTAAAAVCPLTLHVVELAPLLLQLLLQILALALQRRQGFPLLEPLTGHLRGARADTTTNNNNNRQTDRKRESQTKGMSSGGAREERRNKRREEVNVEGEPDGERFAHTVLERD